MTIHGLSVHPGTAKGIMKNAVEIGGEFMAMLPALERPQFTEGREGYFHPFVFEGTVEKTYIRCLVRDHELDRYEERKAYVISLSLIHILQKEIVKKLKELTFPLASIVVALFLHHSP